MSLRQHRSTHSLLAAPPGAVGRRPPPHRRIPPRLRPRGARPRARDRAGHVLPDDRARRGVPAWHQVSDGAQLQMRPTTADPELLLQDEYPFRNTRKHNARAPPPAQKRELLDATAPRRRPPRRVGPSARHSTGCCTRRATSLRGHAAQRCALLMEGMVERWEAVNRGEGVALNWGLELDPLEMAGYPRPPVEVELGMGMGVGVRVGQNARLDEGRQYVEDGGQVPPLPTALLPGFDVEYTFSSHWNEVAFWETLAHDQPT
ncbi:hypothetical protein C8R44DRAFT_725832 [Mycena epipterygia]|nr:hypothetical protein C8R44DRAFT_725832 [Mycena epipterygia]